jgi:HEAT repeat protein
MRLGVWFRWKVVLVLSAGLAIASAQAADTSAPAKSGDAMAKIEAMIEKIRTERSIDIRMDIAQQLSTLIGHLDHSDLLSLDSSVIDDIASLLTDRYDGVRMWAAAALGQIGAPAARAIPALERALKESEPVPGSGVIGPDLSSDMAIRPALQKITGKSEGPARRE